MNPPARGSAIVGATYFMTNEPQGNFIVASDIGSDGKLTLRNAFSTEGAGGHGNDGGNNGPDPLFTQGAVKASSAGGVVAAVNPGSSTISLFKINPNAPSELSMIGRPIGSGGEFPVSLAFNAAATSLCAVNGGEVNSVSCFKVDKTNGLSPIPGSNRPLGLNQTTPASGPPNSVSHIIFTEDGKSLITDVKGDPTTTPPTPGFLAVFDVAADGSLSKSFKSIAPPTGGLLPFSMTVIPGKNAVLATDAAIGFSMFDLSGGAQASALNSAVKIDGQGATCWSSFSKKTGNFYLTDIGTSIVTEVNVDNNLKGTIVKQYPQGAGIATIDNDIASVGNNDFMYVMSPNATSIQVLALNAPGKAQNIQKVDFSGPAKRAGLTVTKSNIQGMTVFLKK